MRQRLIDGKWTFAKSLRASATDAEVALWRLLRSRRLAGMKFRRQAPIGDWIVDFVSFECRLVVEADDSQHADSVHDTRRDQDLASRGFRILRFWNNEILLKPDVIAEAIFASSAQTPSTGELRPPPSPSRGEGSKKSAENG